MLDFFVILCENFSEFIKIIGVVMGICANYLLFSEDISSDLKSTHDAIRRDFSNVDLPSLYRDFKNMVHIVLKKGSMHYPKILTTAAVIQALITLVFPSITGIIGILSNLYISHRYKNYFSTAMRIHNENNISELYSPYQEKKALERTIKIAIFGQEPFQIIKDFFHRVFC